MLNNTGYLNEMFGIIDYSTNPFTFYDLHIQI